MLGEEPADPSCRSAEGPQPRWPHAALQPTQYGSAHAGHTADRQRAHPRTLPRGEELYWSSGQYFETSHQQLFLIQ